MSCDRNYYRLRVLLNCGQRNEAAILICIDNGVSDVDKLAAFRDTEYPGYGVVWPCVLPWRSVNPLPVPPSKLTPTMALNLADDQF